MTSDRVPESRYLDHLPAIFRTPQDDGKGGILGAFLRAFEDVLSGTGDPKQPGLAELIHGIAPAGGSRPLAGLHRYFEPGHDRKDGEDGERTPREFLDWLAGWVALSLRADLDEATQREFIARAVSLYQLRGTAKGLADILEIYTRLGVTIDEGKTGFPPHYFEVTLRLDKLPQNVAKELATISSRDQQGAPSMPREVARYRTIATEIIDAEKPAHCFYGLKIIAVSFQLNVTSRVGVDTLLASD